MKNPKCRSCAYPRLELILSLGYLPLANALLTSSELNEPEERYYLDLLFCPRCSLVQISETVPPEKLFEEYAYLSSFSDTVLENAKNISERMTKRLGLNTNSMIVEIASNDGYLLQYYQKKGIPVRGIEPARNIVHVAQERGVPTINEFFNKASAQRLLDDGLSADLIHANNVIAHVADLHSVISGIALLLKPDGVVVVENHYVKDLIDHVEFDSVYHEHLCYYSVTSFEHLFRQHGLILVDVERIPIHGGSIRVFFQRADGPCSQMRSGVKRVQKMLLDEKAWGVNDFKFYKDFGNKIENLRKNLVLLLGRLKNEGKRIVAYGASAKSTTLLNYFSIGSETLDYVVDRSTVKQNHYTPGTHLPICSPDKLLETQPEYVLILAWNFSEEILAQQLEYSRRGGRFIIPIPDMKVV